MEISLNSAKYNLKGNNNSRDFWQKLTESEVYKYLNKFKGETLRKYWRKIRFTGHSKKLIQAIKDNKNKLNTNMKLLQSINAVCDYIECPKRGIDYYVHKYTKASGNKSNDESKGKKKFSDIDFDFSNVSSLECMEYITGQFRKYFPEFSRNTIAKKFYQVNGEIKDLYLVLLSEKDYGYLCFNEEEDNIIKTGDTTSEDYCKLIKEKGFNRVSARKEFLFNIK